MRLEFPIGNVLYKTAGGISHIRFSPKGDRIAFMDHPDAWDDRGTVCVVDLYGKKRHCRQSGPRKKGWHGLPKAMKYGLPQRRQEPVIGS